MSKMLDKESLSALVKLGIFLTFTGLCTVFLMMVLGNGAFTSRNDYKAVFTDATGVAKGDDVRIAGVPVGFVKSVKVYKKTQAVVEFAVDKEIELTESTTATLKFRNLVGQRYMSLARDGDGSDARIAPGGTLGLDQTQDALDLNLLLNGFKPVFQALQPDDINKFAFEIVETLQGESGSVQALLARTSSLTSTLADRDELIGDTIANLSTTLDIVGSRDAELSDTIIALQQFVTGLKNDRQAILGSIDSISALSVQTADLLQDARPPLQRDIKALNSLTKGLAKPKNLTQLQESVRILPHKLEKFGNAASSGSEFTFYLCNLEVQLDLPGLPLPDISQLLPQVGGPRCEEQK